MTVLRAMFDSRQAFTTPALFTAQHTEILLHFNAYGLLVKMFCKVCRVGSVVLSGQYNCSYFPHTNFTQSDMRDDIPRQKIYFCRELRNCPEASLKD